MAPPGPGGAAPFGLADMPKLSLQVLQGRWFMVFASFLIMSTTGANHMFPLYSGDIKTSLGYDQTTLNLLSFFKDLGANVGILPGLINEVTPPWVVLSLGAVLNFFGFFMIWLVVTKKISEPRVWLMCLYMCIGANSQAFTNTGVTITCVKNFPESRGLVLGLIKGYAGLCGAIITQLYYAIYFNDTKALILLVSWFPAAISFLFLKTIRIIKVVRQPNEVKVFYKFLYVSLGLATFLMIMIIIQKVRDEFTKSEYGASAAGVMFLLFLPLAIVIWEEYKHIRDKKSCLHNPLNPIETTSEEPELGNFSKFTPIAEIGTRTDPVVERKKQPSCWKTVLKPPNRGEDYTILQALFSIDMLILFLAITCGIGGTLTAIDNLGQIGISLGYPKKSISTFISLVSIWSYLGRVVAGFLSESLLTKFKFPRTLMLTITLLAACIGHVLIAFNVPSGLYIASIIIGFCFGAQWPLIFAIISELFGLKYYSTLYNFGSAASPVGVYLLNVPVTGHLYDKEAKRQMEALGLTRKAGEELACNGVKCFQLAFIIITVATLFGALVSFVLVLRTRKFYKSDIYKKFRVEAKEAEAQIALDGNRVNSNSMETKQ